MSDRQRKRILLLMVKGDSPMNYLTDFTTHTELSPKRVRAVFGGQTIADSTNALLVWEHNNYPEYYFPRSDIQ
ncbi:MAG: DUF427 domain-containing protein, partial [Acidimicrobiales bacterium]